MLLLAPLAAILLSPAQPALESAVLAEINFARQQPQAYAERLRAYRTTFRGKIAYYPGSRDGLLTKEGVRAVDEAIRFLEKQVPLPPLAPSRLLAQAAGDHVQEQGARGGLGHFSADGSNPRDRVQRRGGGVYVAETITYGPASGVEVVRQLIVDDDVPGRGHRKTVFAAEMRFAGVGCGAHRSYRTMCVAEFGRTPTGKP